MPVELRGLDEYNRWDIANVMRGRANGTVSAYAYAKLGDITTDQFDGLAQIQRDFDVDVRITNRQNFVLRGLTEEQLPELHARLAAIDMPAEIAMRHATAHFSHVFSGEGYAAGYYSYLWSEVLDADAFDAFAETGDIFNADVARKLRDFIYAAGGRREPADAYIAFRGRLPNADALLKKRGLLEVSAEV